MPSATAFPPNSTAQPVPEELLPTWEPEMVVWRDHWNLAGLTFHTGMASSVLSPFDRPVDFSHQHFTSPPSILHPGYARSGLLGLLWIPVLPPEHL